MWSMREREKPNNDMRSMSEQLEEWICRFLSSRGLLKERVCWVGGGKNLTLNISS